MAEATSHTGAFHSAAQQRGTPRPERAAVSGGRLDTAACRAARSPTGGRPPAGNALKTPTTDSRFRRGAKAKPRRSFSAPWPHTHRPCRGSGGSFLFGEGGGRANAGAAVAVCFSHREIVGEAVSVRSAVGQRLVVRGVAEQVADGGRHLPLDLQRPQHSLSPLSRLASQKNKKRFSSSLAAAEGSGPQTAGRRRSVSLALRGGGGGQAGGGRLGQQEGGGRLGQAGGGTSSGIAKCQLRRLFSQPRW